ncbi:hypothetical protein ACJJIF_07420 [Microbulbifer sp. SSSA002]|uniref:hypothetical protein n=1 Tax=unclassified Microbulbifer TaxID=2619833 RepID=UPI00403A5B86
MQKPYGWIGCALSATLSFFLVSQSAIAKNDDTLITDPVVLEAMGFERDANNVYAAKGVNLDRSREPVLKSTDSPDAQQELFPSGSTDYSPITPKEFIGRVDTTGTQWLYNAGISFELSRLGTERFADAQFDDLPNGGTLEFYRWWWSDNDTASMMETFVFEICQPAFAGGAITYTTLASSPSFDSTTGSTVVSLSSRPIDTQSCYYLARVRFDAATTLLELQKVRLQFIHP